MNNKKFIAAIAAGALALGCTIGGTIAWLTASSDTIVNTFTTSDISVKLEETDAIQKAEGVLAKSFQMIPGWTIDKDPKATVIDGSEDCWLFVEITESDNFDDFMTYAIADDWTTVQEETNGVTVIGRKVLKTDSTKSFAVLEGDKVTVKTSVTKEDMTALTDATLPTLTFQAFASQLYKTNSTAENSEFTAAQAWANVANPDGE